jgi:hypothetical protein
MELGLTIVLMLFCLQGLVKFVIGFLVPYEKRITRIRSYYGRDGRTIRRYDDITLVIMVALVVLLSLTDMQYLSFIAGYLIGLLTLQLFFHRFIEIMPPDKRPEEPAPPVKHVSYAIQAAPGLAWKEIAFMAIILGWGLYMLVARGLFG